MARSRRPWTDSARKDGCPQTPLTAESNRRASAAWRTSVFADTFTASLAALSSEQQTAAKTTAFAVGTMHLAKGLEFRAVAVAACDDEILPLQSRIESIADPADLEEVYDTERHLLYVACTRAREQSLVTGVKPASEFLEDLLARHRP